MADVQVWRSQLAANDFPPVCAMTGAPAETWRKFTFTTTPAWALMFGAVGAAAFSNRATGYLPLTKASSKRITNVRWLFLGLIPVAIVLFIAAAFAAPSDPNNDSTRSTITAVLVLLAIAALFLALLGVLMARSYFGPTARIIERREYHEPLVEIRRVHPAFAAAVQQHQQARAAQVAAPPPRQPPPPPESPFPPGKFSY